MTDLFDIEITADDIAQALATEDTTNKKTATAWRTKTKRQNRRAKSEATLAQILPHTIEPGDAWHIMSHGDIDALSYMAHIVQRHSIDYALFSTWCMAMPDVTQIGNWLDTGAIKKLDAYVGEIFPNQYPIETEALAAIMRRHGGRMCICKNHSKVMLLRNATNTWVIESSANINTNPRIENTVITADAGLYDHHKQFFDGLRSFTRDFDHWTPQPPCKSA